MIIYIPLKNSMNYSEDRLPENGCLEPVFTNSSDGEDQVVYCDGPEASSNVQIQRVVLMSIFMVLALAGNAGVLIVLYRSKKVHQPVSTFLISLAASDILIALFSMPTEVFWNVFGGWIFGSFACKSLTYLQFILFASTAHIHMCVSYDRYEAICKPRAVSRRIYRNCWMIGISWLLAFVMAVPQLLIFEQVNVGVRVDGSLIAQCSSTGYTAEWQRKFYVTWIAVYMFLIPLICIASCYSRILLGIWRCDRRLAMHSDPEEMKIRSAAFHKSGSHLCEQAYTLSRAKIKTIQVTVCILVSYTFCWIPYFTVQLLNVWSDYAYLESINSSSVGVLAQCLCWFSSCVNPIIYGCFNLPSCLSRIVSCCRCQCDDRPRSLTVNGRRLPYPSNLHRPNALAYNVTTAQRSPFRRLLTKSADDAPKRTTRSDGSDQPLVVVPSRMTKPATG